MGRGGNTQNCAAPELYFPFHDNNPDVCCYCREALNEYFYRPSKVVGSWKSIGALDPTTKSCRTIGTTISESLAHNYEKQVTDSLQAGFGIELEGISASASATHSVQQTWSTSSSWSKVQTQSETDCDQIDVIKDYVSHGWIWKWQWKAETTTKWGTKYETVFRDAAYTQNEAHPPKCAPGFYAQGHYPDYQVCDNSAAIGYANQSMAELLESDLVTNGIQV